MASILPLTHVCISDVFVCRDETKEKLTKHLKSFKSSSTDMKKTNISIFGVVVDSSSFQNMYINYASEINHS